MRLEGKTVQRKIALFSLMALLLAGCSGVKDQSNGGGGSGGSASLTGLAVTPPAATVIVSSTQNLKATGTYSDGSSKDLTGSVTWSSANSTTASVKIGRAHV